jgi:hypothetical protein
MGGRNSKHSSRKGKSKKSRAKNNESNLSNRQENLEQQASQHLSEAISESTVEQPESNIEHKEGIVIGDSGSSSETSGTNTTKNTSETGGINTTESTGETSSANTAESTAETTGDINQCYEEIKAKQQELLNNLKNLSDAIGYATLTRDNIASLNVELLSNIYFTREVRPLIDAVNLITFASSNMSIVAQNININASGDRKEIKNAFKLCYKMNDEIEELLNTLTRRIKLYVAQLDKMDKNCPPCFFEEDS